MLPLKLVRSLVLGESLVHSQNDESESASKTKTPLLVFLPTKELVSDTYRLATIAREMGMDLYPTPALSHIIFSYPFSGSTSPSHSSSSSSSWSSISLSSSLILPKDAVPLPFPSLTTSSLSHLRSFVSLSKGFFKLVFIPHNHNSHSTHHIVENSSSHWNCCSFSLFSRLNGDRIDTMDAFSRALAGMGWTFFKTKKNPSPDSAAPAKSVFLFRKVDSGRVRALRDNGGCRIRELRLPPLDFRNAPLRILQYIILMTDDVFYLA
ncbi:hypothetical protein ACOSQ3_024116 [Xanthoceras sorbifolium]